MRKVFISYAREDARAAFRLSESLKAAGVKTWFDQERILPGQKWEDEVRRAIRQSDYFIAVLSSLSLGKRGFVQKEIRQALDILDEFPDSHIYLIPVRLDDCLIDHERLRAIQWVNLFPSWEVGVELILRAIQRSVALQRTTEESAFVPLSSIPILSSNVIREVLETDVVSPHNYRSYLAWGGSLFLALSSSIIVLAALFDTSDPQWNPLAGLFFVAFSVSFYLIGQGVVRWSRSFRVRRGIVRANEIVANNFRAKNPVLYRLLLGSWPWRIVLAAILISLLALAFITLFLILISIVATSHGEHGAGLGILCVAAVPGGGLYLWARVLERRLLVLLSRVYATSFSLSQN